MDLSEIKPETVDLEITHPATGEKTGLIVTLCSMEDDRVKAVKRQLIDKRMRAKKNSFTAQDIESGTTEILAACVVNWKWGGDATWNGKKPDCTRAAVKEVLGVDWIASQIDEEVGDSTAFFTT